jgi:hypothetical protein
VLCWTWWTRFARQPSRSEANTGTSPVAPLGGLGGVDSDGGQQSDRPPSVATQARCSVVVGTEIASTLAPRCHMQPRVTLARTLASGCAPLAGPFRSKVPGPPGPFRVAAWRAWHRA